MKKFAVQLALFLFCAFILLNIYGIVLFKLDHFEGLFENTQIYISIFKSQKKQEKTRVFVIGDSVANQMYFCSDYNDSINSLCTVMPLTMAGQYLLLKSVCENNDMTNKKVVLLLSPSALSSDFDDSHSFHYFLKPFYNRWYKKYFDEYLTERIESPVLAGISQLPVVKLSNYSNKSYCLNFFTEIQQEDEYLSRTSMHYLLCMSALSEEAGFEFQILPTLQNEARKDYVNTFREHIQKSDVSHLFQEYFKQIIYLERNKFGDDMVHFKEPLSEYNVLDL